MNPAVSAAKLSVLVLLLTACTSQTASPGPTPLSSPPAAVPILLFATDKAVRAVSWTGREYRAPAGIPEPSITWVPGNERVVPSPDGLKFLGASNHIWTHGSILPGRPTLPPNLDLPTWADDSARLCGIANNPDGTSSLWVADPSGVWSSLTRVGNWVFNLGAPTIAACSYSSKRIAITGVGGGNGETGEVWIIGWDGTVLLHRQGPTKTAHIYTFSTDASTIADFDESTGDTAILDVTGAQLGSLKGAFVEAFSLSGRYVLAMDSGYNPGSRPIHGPYLLDRRTNRVLWHAFGADLLDTGVFGAVRLQPRGDGFAFPLESTDCVNAARCNEVLQVVSPAGAWRLKGPAYLQWFAVWP